MKAYLFLADGFEEMEVIYPLSILRTAGFDILTVSTKESLSVTGAHKVNIIADITFADRDLFDADIIILPGGQPGTNNLRCYSPLKELIRFYAKHKFVAAICAAPSILGEMGLLEGKEAVCYPGFEENLLGATIAKSKVAIDGNIITAVGPGAAQEFALTIVSHLQAANNF